MFLINIQQSSNTFFQISFIVLKHHIFGSILKVYNKGDCVQIFRNFIVYTTLRAKQTHLYRDTQIEDNVLFIL